MKNGLTKTILSMSIIVIISSLAGCGPGGNLTIPEKQQVIMDMEKEILARLYREAPETKGKIEKAAGYGIFSNANVNLIFISA